MYRLVFVLAGGLILAGCPTDKPVDDSDPGTTDDSDTTPAIDADGDGFDVDEDCDDADNGVYPGAAEVCDGSDNDCDGSTDEEATDTRTWYADSDGDGHGDPGSAVEACSAPAGHISSADDCDDADAASYPGADEVCDGADNDCDGLTDDADDGVTGGGTWYADADADGYGDPAAPVVGCAQPAGTALDPVDCDDGRADVRPGGAELCDGADNDCDGTPDDGLASVTSWPDMDGDRYGDDAGVYTGCDTPAGNVLAGGDCDDADLAVNPGAQEVCDARDVDEDCDGLAEEADPSVSGASWWYPDVDGDGYGDTDGSARTCDQPAGTVSNPFDPFEDAVLADFAQDPDLSDCADVAAGRVAVYAICFDSVGDPAVVSVDMAGNFAVLYSGAPLSFPTGLALSMDQQTLYVVDAAYDGGAVSGGVFEVPVSGGAATEIGAAGLIDVPVDIAQGAGMSSYYVTGYTAAGDAAIFEVDVASGAVSTFASGGELVDPLSISRDVRTGELYVLDSMAGDGRAALIWFDGSGNYRGEAATGFRMPFGAGLDVDSTGLGAVYATRDGLTHLILDGTWTEEALDSALIGTPGGVAHGMNEVLYVTEIGAGTSDIYTITY